MYRAPTNQSLKSFPWEGASSETLPLIATATDQLYAKFMQTLHAAPLLWSVSALNERWVDVAKPMQDFLGLLDTAILRMYDVNRRALLEMCKLGTAIYETGWTYEKRRVRVYDAQGKPQLVVKVRSVPFVDHVRLADFLLPPQSYAIDPDKQGGAPWVAKRIRVTPERLKMLAKATEPNAPNLSQEDLDAILMYKEPSLTVYDTNVVKQDYQRRFANEAPIETPTANEVPTAFGSIGPINQIELWEVHARFNAQEDVYDDLVCLYHLPTGRIVRTTLNPYAHGQRPFSVVRYFPGEGFYGIGVCEQMEMFQRVQSDLYNYAKDNALLSNALMLAAKAGANIQPGELLYPGKVLITEGDPRAEVMPFSMGQPNASIQALISMTEVHGERRSGISDIQLGSVNDLPGRTPATTMVSLLQEGNRRPDLTIKDMRYEGLSRVGLQIIQLLQQYLTSAVDTDQGTMLRVMTESLGMPEGQKLADQLLMPNDAAELGLGVTITATSGSNNKEVDRQQAQARIQLAASVAPQIIQFTQMAEQMQQTMPMTASVAMKSAQALVELFRRALEQDDVRDSEKIIPESNTNGVNPQPSVPQAPVDPATGLPVSGAEQGPGGGGAGAPISPGLAALLQGLGNTGGYASPPPAGVPAGV